MDKEAVNLKTYFADFEIAKSTIYVDNIKSRSYAPGSEPIFKCKKKKKILLGEKWDKGHIKYKINEANNSWCLWICWAMSKGKNGYANEKFLRFSGECCAMFWILVSKSFKSLEFCRGGEFSFDA